jgi:transmembrane protein 222
MGIADSQGKIHDFAGPYCIGVDRFMVGLVLRYARVEGAEEDPEGWDEAIQKADASGVWAVR